MLSIRPASCAHACCLVLIMASSAVRADSLQELSELVNAKDSAGAWSMAQRMEPVSSGDAEFDFWYAQAAKAAGEKNVALFAFERVLLAQPENALAKLELADLHFQFGNTGDARALFEEVLLVNPPEAIQQKVRTYLAAIEAAEQRKKTQVTYTLGLVAGHDSNVGSATDIAMHDTFLGPATLQLNPQSMAIDAAFLETKAAVDVVRPSSQRSFTFLSAGVQRRDNEEILQGGNYDFTQLSVTGGWLLRRGIATWRFPVGVQALWAESPRTTAAPVNDDRYVSFAGAEYSRPLSERTSLAWFARLGDSHYPSASDRNTYLVMTGGGYTWSPESAPVSINTSLHVVYEPAQEDTALALSNEKDMTLGLRISMRWQMAERHSLVVGLGLQDTTYRNAPAIFPVGSPDRHDMQIDFSPAWLWQVDRNWSINAEISALQNDSQQSLYDYDRTQFRLGSTWRF